MKIAKLITLLGWLAMTAVLIYGFTVGNFVEEGKQLLSMPWGIAPQKSLVWFEQSAHFPQLEEPQTFADELSKILSETN